MATPEKGEWERVSKDRPCPICEKTDYCRIGTRLVHCQRVQSDKPGKTTGWYHPLNGISLPPQEPRKPPPRRKRDEELDGCFAKAVACWYAAGAEKVAKLAKQLGVNAEALQSLGVGWNGFSWTVPERNPNGLVTGVSLRHADGSKMMVVGSRRGLVYRSDLRQHLAETVLIVEGMTDVSAALTLGIVAVGRPNNSGGGTLLAALLRGWQGTIVVMGENDRREPKLPKGGTHASECSGCGLCFPGKYGAEAVAKVLRKALRGPRISIRFPPPGFKDLREWASKAIRNPDDVKACGNLGRSFLRLIHIQ